MNSKNEKELNRYLGEDVVSSRSIFEDEELSSTSVTLVQLVFTIGGQFQVRIIERGGQPRCLGSLARTEEEAVASALERMKYEIVLMSQIELLFGRERTKLGCRIEEKL